MQIEPPLPLLLTPASPLLLTPTSPALFAWSAFLSPVNITCTTSRSVPVSQLTCCLGHHSAQLPHSADHQSLGGTSHFRAPC